MELFDTTLVGLERAMSGSALRQQVIANNIANANTPGYKRSDVDFHVGARAGVRRTADREPMDQTDVLASQADSTSAMRVDGNNVDIDSEMAEPLREHARLPGARVGHGAPACRS